MVLNFYYQCVKMSFPEKKTSLVKVNDSVFYVVYNTFPPNY